MGRPDAGPLRKQERVGASGERRPRTLEAGSERDRLGPGRRTLTRVTCALLCAHLMGCAPVTLAANWRDTHYRGPAFHQILVVGVAESAEDRQALEEAVAAALEEQGIATIISAGRDLILTQDADAVRAAGVLPGVDGLIVCRAVSQRASSGAAPASQPEAEGGFDLYRAAPSALAHAAPSQVLDMEVFAVHPKRLVWWGWVSSLSENSGPAAEAIAALVVQQLQAARLLGTGDAAGTAHKREPLGAIGNPRS